MRYSDACEKNNDMCTIQLNTELSVQITYRSQEDKTMQGDNGVIEGLKSHNETLCRHGNVPNP